MQEPFKMLEVANRFDLPRQNRFRRRTSERPMNIEEVPFHQHLGIRRSSKPGFLLEMGEVGIDSLRNHAGTIHAAAIAALAEASTGEALLQLIPSDEEIGAVVCRSNSRYTNPALGVIRSRVETEESDLAKAIASLQTKRRNLDEIEVKVFADNEVLVARFSFTWLISRIAPSPES